MSVLSADTASIWVLEPQSNFIVPVVVPTQLDHDRLLRWGALHLQNSGKRVGRTVVRRLRSPLHEHNLSHEHIHMNPRHVHETTPAPTRARHHTRSANIQSHFTKHTLAGNLTSPN